jgi:hypothetical protein
MYLRLALAVLFAFTVLSQTVSQPPAKTEPYPINREREDIAEKDVPKSSDINTLQRFALSPEPDNIIKTDAEKANAEKVIKYYLYRLTWEEIQKERDPSKGTIDSIMSDLIGTVENNPRLLPRYFTGAAADQDMANQRLRQFTNVQQLAPIYIKHAKVLLQNKMPIARINAVRVLAKLAEWGQDAVLDEFINIINHPLENIAVKHWAFRGLEEIQNLQGSSDIKAKNLFQSKASQAKLNDALMATYNWLVQNTSIPEVRMQHMKQEEQAGIRYVRRAAIAALGASHRAVIVDDRQAGKQAGTVADLLNKILAAEPGIVPQPDLRERLEALHALALLRTDVSPSYNPDFTAYQIGTFLTVLGSEANTQKNNGNLTLAWPMEAQRLLTSLQAFAKQKMSPAATEYVRKLGEKTRPLFEFFNDFNVNTQSVRDLSEFVRDNPSPSKQAIKPLGEK